MATTDKNFGIFDMTQPATLMHPSLAEAKPYMENGKAKGDPKYSATFLFSPDHVDLAGAKAKAIAVAQAEWPGVELNTVKWPFTAGDVAAAKREAKSKDGNVYKGKIILKTTSLFPPKASWVDTGGAFHECMSNELGPNASKFYQGVQALGTINFRAATVNGNRYVTAYLNIVFSTQKGERIGGGKSAAEAFKGYIGQATTEDPTKGSVADTSMGF